METVKDHVEFEKGVWYNNQFIEWDIIYGVLEVIRFEAERWCDHDTMINTRDCIQMLKDRFEITNIGTKNV